ncbi:excitatory amino acid transporter 1-like isoform X2 [Chelonus insularis]|uniref:excitatory amino acid transporter 1-like isoform X2 n=1 Tax=Chelonus insularis TaxID=460826 RepID=UPI00158CF07B|nr:excitatory amino acid transporter 1-like isoform X2 [Chelonus insularis]
MSECTKHRDTILTLTSIIVAIVIGIMLKNLTPQPWFDRAIMYYQFPGEIFLRIINCLILPLIVSSIISASCDLSKSGSIGLKALYYYSTTTILGIILAVVLTETIRPDILRNLFSDNIVKTCLSQYQTILLPSENITEDIHYWKISHQYNDGVNVLGLVGFSLIVGIAIGCLNDDGKYLADCFKALSQATMMMMNGVIRIVPLSILFLIPGKLLQTENIQTMLSNLGMLVITVIVGLLTHSFIVLPLLYFICTRKSPLNIFSKIGPAIITAIGTSSSTATVPMTIKCLDDIGVNPRVSRFTVPIGATINMDGVALYETIGAIFLVQQRGLHFSLLQVIALAITCTVSCIGAAGLPNGGYAMLIVVLESIGIPAEDVTFIIIIDCFVDRLRTTVNIVTDTFGATIINHLIENKPDIELNEVEVNTKMLAEQD